MSRAMRRQTLSTDISTKEHFVHTAIAHLITRPSVLLGSAIRWAAQRQYGLAKPQSPSVILVTIVENLGDFVIASGLLRGLRAAYPQANIVLIVNRSYYAYAEKCPYANKVLGFSESGSAGYRALVGPIRALTFARRHLWPLKPDLSIHPRWDVDSRHGGLIGHFSLSAHHLGFSAQCNERKRIINKFLDGAFSQAIESTKVKHESERGGELLQSLGVSTKVHSAEIWIDESEQAFADAELAGITRPLIAIGVGAFERRREWPVERFAELCRELAKAYPSASFVLIGSRADAARCGYLISLFGHNMKNLAGRCTVGMSGAVLLRSDLYIGNDSGPIHIAAAVGTPVVQNYCQTAI
jgi:ADP-heptose:LPS heptosyltransferase